MEETTSFLNSLLASHGPNYLEKLFGSKARHRLRDLGGVNTVAIALSGKYIISSPVVMEFLLVVHFFKNTLFLKLFFRNVAPFFSSCTT